MMPRSPPLRAALLAALLVLAPVGAVAAVGAVPAATAAGSDTVTDRTDHADRADRTDRTDHADRADQTRSVRATQPGATVLNVTVDGRTAVGAGAPTMVNVSATVATALDLDASRVRVDRTDDTVEVLANRSDGAVRAALDAAGVDTAYVVVRGGVSNATREAVAAALRERIAAAGLDANTSVTVAGASGLRVRTTAVDRVRSLVTTRGDTSLVAGAPGPDGPRRLELVDASGLADVGTVRARAGGAPFVPVTLTEAAARNFSRTLVETGLTDAANTSSCRYDDSPAAPGYCIFTVVDGSVVYAASLSPGFADDIRSGGFVKDPRFVVTATSASTARRLATTLRTGPLPAPLRVTGVTTVDATPPADGPTPVTPFPPPPTAKPTTTDTPTASPSGVDDDDDRTDTGGQRGFTTLVTVVALLAAAGLGRRRYSP